MRGVRLILTHPELPTCADCKFWLYDPKTWQTIKRKGERVKREQDESTPCHQCPKIQTGEPATPEQGETAQLSGKNWSCYLHYLKCKATLRFPEDETVEHNAGLIRMIEDQVDRDAGIEPMAMMLGTVLKFQSKRR